MFHGIYNGSQKHPDDLDIVLQRAWANGLDKMIVTVGCLKDTDEAVKITEGDGMCLFRYSFLLKCSFCMLALSHFP